MIANCEEIVINNLFQLQTILLLSNFVAESYSNHQLMNRKLLLASLSMDTKEKLDIVDLGKYITGPQ